MGDFFLKSVRWTPSDYRDVITNYIIEECGDDRQGLILFSQFVVSYVSQFEDFCQRGITVMWLQSWSMWRWQKSKVNVTCPENRSVGRRTARTTTGWSNDNKLRPASTLPQFLTRQRQRQWQWQRQRHRQSADPTTTNFDPPPPPCLQILTKTSYFVSCLLTTW